jgi:hypothetical protein
MRPAVCFTYNASSGRVGMESQQENVNIRPTSHQQYTPRTEVFSDSQFEPTVPKRFDPRVDIDITQPHKIKTRQNAASPLQGPSRWLRRDRPPRSPMLMLLSSSHNPQHNKMLGTNHTAVWYSMAMMITWSSCSPSAFPSSLTNSANGDGGGGGGGGGGGLPSSQTQVSWNTSHAALVFWLKQVGL